MTNTVLFVQLFMGFLLGVAGSNCPITLTPSRVVVRNGDPVSINCTAEEDHVGMGWESPHNPIEMMRVNHLTWSVETTTQSTEAICFINPMVGEQCGKKADIVLYSYPQTIQITSNSSDGIMKEGKDYYLICDVNDVSPAKYRSVVWYKNNITHGTSNSSSYKLYNVTRDLNRAEIRCEAHLDLRPESLYTIISSEIFRINVMFGPEMTCSNHVTIAEGDTLDSKCPVDGNPTPHVMWFKNGQQINSSVPLRREDAGTYTAHTSRFFIDINVDVSYGPELSCPHYFTVLENTRVNLNCTVRGYPKPKVALYKDGEEVHLEIITRTDAGNYTLVASTENENVTETFEVFVDYPPSPIFELEGSSFTLGSSVYLKCYARGNPRPKYSWMYYNISNVSERNVDGVSILEIQNATTFNIGNYTCGASNKHGQVYKTVRLTVKGVKQECPLQITPERMVLEYNSERKSATCTAISPANSKEIYWLENSGNNTSNNEWVADTHNWNASPVCEGSFNGIGSCRKKLDFILYKKPDSVSISIEGNATVMEKMPCTLVCEITNVAPAKSVMVHWFKGNESFTPPNGVHVICDKNCNETKESMQMWFKTIITVDRTQNGVEFSCAAVLKLPGIQEDISLPVSRPLSATVHYSPSINTTKLSHIVPVFSGYAEDLKCEADGNPRPTISWTANVELPPQQSDGLISVTEKGKYICNATNTYGSVTHEVEVIEKGHSTDSCPLEITPSRVVVEHGGAFTVDCNSTTSELDGMGWESNYQGTDFERAPHVQLKIERVDRWEIESMCYITLKNGSQCIKSLPITVYKKPDRVFILPENLIMEEHKEYELQCNVSNVAPAASVSVAWYIGDTRIKKEKLINVSEPSPYTGASLLKITADKQNDGKTVMCEAKFDFGPTGPHLMPTRSELLELHVQYQPAFKDPKVEMVEVSASGKITLDCTAQGNPSPTYLWQVPEPTEPQVGNQPVLDLQGPFPGSYNCTASNSQGSSIKQFVLTDAPRDYTVLGAVLGVPAALGFLLLISGPFIVTKDGTFSLNKGGYSRGQASKPI